MMKLLPVTAVVCTKNRYDTTLPLCLLSIANQTYKPKELLILDDSDERVKMDEHHILSMVLRTLDEKFIQWKVVYGNKRGQGTLHDISRKMAEYEWIWRLDDDNYAEPNVLEELMKVVDTCKANKTSVGAVAGLVHTPGLIFQENDVASSDMKNWAMCLHVQWYKYDLNGPRWMFVDHLYSTFVYSKEAGSHGYNLDLSPVSHTEETQFTYEMRRKGYVLIVTKDALTWHYKQNIGGIRAYKDSWLWEHDSKLFRNKLINEWKVETSKFKSIILDSGIGDHFAFLSIYPLIREAFPKHQFIISCTYPEVFEDLRPEVKVVGLEFGKAMAGDISSWNIYNFMWQQGWSSHITEAYLDLYITKNKGELI